MELDFEEQDFLDTFLVGLGFKRETLLQQGARVAAKAANGGETHNCIKQPRPDQCFMCALAQS